MALRVEDALREERISLPSGEQRTVFIFQCVSCKGDLRIRERSLKTSSGMCRPCWYKSPKLYLAKRPYEALYNTFLKTCRHAKHAVSISYEQFVTFSDVNECHYCGAPVYWTKKDTNRNGAAYNLDRKDNSKDYLMDNVVVCCRKCNYLKSDEFSYQEFLAVSALLKKSRALPEPRFSIEAWWPSYEGEVAPCGVFD